MKLFLNYLLTMPPLMSYIVFSGKLITECQTQNPIPCLQKCNLRELGFLVEPIVESAFLLPLLPQLWRSLKSLTKTRLSPLKSWNLQKNYLQNPLKNNSFAPRSTAEGRFPHIFEFDRNNLMLSKGVLPVKSSGSQSYILGCVMASELRRFKSLLPVQIDIYDKDQRIPVVYYFDTGREDSLLTHQEVDELIALLKQYKNTFKKEDIESAPGVHASNSQHILNAFLQRKRNQKGWVYVIHAINLGLFKIGCSKNPSERLSQLIKSQIPSELVLVHQSKSDSMYTDEKAVHRLYTERKVSGEWFRLTDEDLTQIKTLSFVKTGGA